MSATEGKARKSAPISTHPVFPAIVSLWFAALFGLGCMILPSVLFERTVSATGIAALVPAAAPPLGLKAKMILAGISALLGAALGFVLGRKVASAQQPKKERRRAAKPIETERRKTPISAHEELGPETFDAPLPAEQPKKRRALAVTDEGGRSEYLREVPLPGGQDPFVLFDEAPLPNAGGKSAQQEMDEEWDEALRQREQQEVQPHATEDEGDLDEDGHAGFSDEAPLDELQRFQASDAAGEIANEGEPAEAAAEPAVPERQVFQPIPELEQAAIAEAAPPESGNQPGESEAPLAFSPPSMARANPEPVEEDSVVEPEPVAMPDAEAPEADYREVPAAAVDTRPVGSLGTVELVERLAMAMRRKEPPAKAPDFSRTAPEVSVGRGDDSASSGTTAFERIVQEKSAADPGSDEQRFQQSDFPRMPSALQPLDLDAEFDDEDDDDAMFELPKIGPSGSGGEDSSAKGNAPGFSMQFAADYGTSARPAMPPASRSAPEYVRIDDEDHADAPPESSVTFPGQRKPRLFDKPNHTASVQGNGLPGAQVPELNREDVPVRGNIDPAETERQLRSALATLQRISGAA